jgi:hypothetical protein
VSAREEVRGSLTGTGRIAQKIVKVAEAENASLIVMGSRGVSDLRGLLLGRRGPQGPAAQLKACAGRPLKARH